MTTNPPAAIAAALGHEPPAAQWPTSGHDPVPIERFGKDHWATFAYVDTAATDHHGVLDHDRMRCSSRVHPMLLPAKTRIRLLGNMADAADHPSIVKGEPDGNGHYGRAEIAEHDDYSCLDDLVAAGLLSVTMPTTNDDGLYIDRLGQVIRFDGEPFCAGFLTGMGEQQLAAHAVWSLTEYGRQVIGALRGAKADGVRFQDFTAPPPAA